MTELAIVSVGAATLATPQTQALNVSGEFVPELDVVATLQIWLENQRSPRTRRTYASGVLHFARWLHGGYEGCLNSLGSFLCNDQTNAARELYKYKASMLAKGDKENTVNVRLASLRAFCKFAYKVGGSRFSGAGLIEGERVQVYRDTRGYDAETLMDILERPFKKHGANSLKGKRDFAIMLLLCENGLRREEVCALQVKDFSMREKQLKILGKGKGTQKVTVTITPKMAGAIGDYLFQAGHAWDEGYLFRNLSRDPDVKPQMTGEAIRLLVRGYGRDIGIEDVAPHKFRHSGTTLALDLTNGNIRAVKKFTRHSKSDTVEIYDDNRKDLQGEITNIISQALTRKGRRKR